MSDCVFCRIASGGIPATIAGESPDAVAFHDLNPQAPTHVLVIPRAHVASARDARNEAGMAAIAGTFVLAAEVAENLGLGEEGYRLVTNVGSNGGQSVFHFHLHLLGGRRMAWPPG